LTSEVFLRVWKGLAGYQNRQKPVLAWIYRIAHARLVDYYRLSSRIGEVDDIEAIELSADDEIDADLMRDFHVQNVEEALSYLVPDQQRVIKLRFIEGHNLQETADLLGKSIGVVKMLQHRALKAVRRNLHFGEDGGSDW